MTRVLLVEDSAMLRRLLVRALTPHYDVLAVEHGGAALEALARSAAFDVLVTDLDMPVVDGLTLIQRLRVDGHRLAASCLVYTSDPGPSAEALADLGIPVLLKPATAVALRAAIERARSGAPA